MRALLILALLTCVPAARADGGGVESERPDRAATSIPGPEITLRAGRSNAHTVVRERARAGKSAPATATFLVEYVGFSEEAQEAFQFAVDVWSTLVESEVPIRIRAVWTALDVSTLGSAGATYLFSDFGAGLPDTWYPSALADALVGEDQNPGDVDLVASFNSIFPNWYFGTSGKTPPGSYDFVSVVMHEIGHGLGFSGSMWMDDGAGSTECDGVAGHACWGYPGFEGVPTSYDRHVRDGLGARLIDNPPFPNPSAALGSALQGGSIAFAGSAAASANDGDPIPLYAPPFWQSGSSYSHLDEATFVAGDPNSLMTPSLSMAELVHDPGPVGCGVLADIGWTVTATCGHFVPPPPPPSAPVTVLPEDGALDVALEPVLVWRASTGAESYEVKVHRLEGGAPVFEAVGIPDTSFAVADLEEDTWYGWNVRAWDATGQGAWSDTASFLTRVSVPDVVVGLDPPDGAVNVPLLPHLKWQPAARAAFYRVEVTADAPPFGLVFSADSVLGTPVVPTGLEIDTAYRWRVQAVNRAGESDWSAESSFHTVPFPPDPPALVHPIAGATVPVPVVLRWTHVADADSYRVQYSYASPIPDAAPSLVTTADSLVLGALDPDRDVFWRVKAGNEGGWSRWSLTRAFHTAAPVAGVPTLVAPADSSVLGNDIVTLSWELVGGAEAYHVQISTNTAFTQIVFASSDVEETSVDADELMRDRWYHWRVRASGEGGDGPWSDVRSFFLLPTPPAAPVLAGPVDGFTAESSSISLSWQAEGATRFHVQIATQADMSEVMAEDSLLDMPTYHFAASGQPGARYWRVRGHNAGGWGEWSAVRTFEMAYITATATGDRHTFALEPNYPNPFSARTHIAFSVGSAGHARLVVMDVLGRAVAVLVDRDVPAGRHVVDLDAGALAVGTYFYRLESGGTSATRAMHVVR
ncbi:MAG TPA: T9SS type A sorting domain-containing protein [Rhodothermales bacterium]